LKFGVEKPVELSGHPLQVQPLIFPRNSKIRQDVCTFCTCNSSVRKSSLLRIGGFDENFRGASYGDDYDFAIRLCQDNGRIVFDPAPELIHLQSPSGGLRLSSSTSKFSEADKALSGWIFLLRHGQQGWRRYLFVNWVLRRTIFLKRNIFRFWRLPLSTIGVIMAYFQARDVEKKGPLSRFSVSE
jgi:GT2 family glycosyltransferase